MYEPLKEAFVAASERIKLGPGLDPQTQMGPLVSDEQLARVTGYLESGVAQGAEVLTGGKRAGERGYFVELPSGVGVFGSASRRSTILAICHSMNAGAFGSW